MDIKRRFRLVEKIAKEMDIEFTDIQLDFLFEDNDYHATCYQMPRVSGKDFITKIRTVIRMLEALEDGNYFNMLIVSPTVQASNKIMNETIDIAVSMLPIKYKNQLICLNSHNEKYLEIFNFKVRYLTTANTTLESGFLCGCRLNEVIINEYNNMNIGNTIDAARLCLMDTEGPLFLLGTFNPNILSNSVSNNILKDSNVTIKRDESGPTYIPIADGLEIGNITMTDSIELTRPSMSIDNNWFRTSSPTVRNNFFFNNDTGRGIPGRLNTDNNETYSFSATSSNLN